MFGEKDYEFMKMALREAEISYYNRGDIPVGAVLTLDNKFIGREGNAARTNSSFLLHAEFLVLHNFSGALKKKSKSSVATLYSTWEPCLHCLGSSVMSRIDKIVYACPDPEGGATNINPSMLKPWYSKHWPEIQQGIYRDDSYNLLVKYMKEHSDKWKGFLQHMEKMHQSWKNNP